MPESRPNLKPHRKPMRNQPIPVRLSERKRVMLGYRQLADLITQMHAGLKAQIERHNALAAEHVGLVDRYNALVVQFNANNRRLRVFEAAFLATAHTHSDILGRTVPFTDVDYQRLLDAELERLKAEAAQQQGCVAAQSIEATFCGLDIVQAAGALTGLFATTTEEEPCPRT